MKISSASSLISAVVNWAGRPFYHASIKQSIASWFVAEVVTTQGEVGMGEISTSSSNRISAPHERSGVIERTAAGASVGNDAVTELPGSGLYDGPAPATDAAGTVAAEFDEPAHAPADPTTAISARAAIPTRIVGPLDSPTLGASNHAGYCGRSIALADILHVMQKIAVT